MVKIDLITGFLGSGKTTFIKKYGSYLMEKGENLGILENDFGAVNVDRMLLSDLQDAGCDVEMVSGGCDYDCHKRRFKTLGCAPAHFPPAHSVPAGCSATGWLLQCGYTAP